ncbi:MAG TPA: LOG family protein [Candidatus Binatia bacterium]|nr:LOG family protein [Candidatus Binatia bacterium]
MPTGKRSALATRRPPRRRRSLAADLLPRLEAETGLTREETFVREMIETSLKLLRDGTSLGDIKVLNGALRELRYAFKVFAPYRHLRKVAAFGSARTRPETPEYRAAHDFAHRIAAEGFMLITGAGGGIMRAYQEGAGRERSFGVNIRLPFEQEPNEFIRDDPKLVTFRYFFTRKLVFLKEADAVVLFPGGFGTHDEGFESLTLVQTGKSKPMPIVFLDAPRGTYWKTWRRYVEDHLLRRGLVSDEDMSLFKVTTSVDAAVQEIRDFYRVYHSSRNVGERFVIRLGRPLAPGLVRALAHEFADIVVSGTIEQGDALAEERQQEPQLAALPRLVFHFNRSSFGRLRQLIDRVNRDG